MSPDPNAGSPSRVATASDLESVRHRFEREWQQRQRPRMEDFLIGVPEPLQKSLLRSLLLIELEYRQGFGDHPLESEYLVRFPHDSAIVKEAFSIFSAMTSTGRLSGVTEVPDGAGTPSNPSLTAKYVNLRLHATGGLGDVYRAIDESLGREVALKFIQERHVTDPDSLEPFFLEAQITSRLDHPGVVPVYGLGESENGRPFYSMRFIEGTQFKTAIDRFHQDRAPHRELHHLLTKLVSVCNTVAYAHNRGIVHRDIKPENIMLGKYGETLLVDWGLAMRIQRDERAKASGEKTIQLHSRTSEPDRSEAGSQSGKSSGSGAGTIGYMSPEQLPDHPGRITAASDIYSLGATLYRLLTNRAPIQGRAETLLLDKIRWGDFPRPRELNPEVPPALEAICMKAMELEPDQRYASALDMAADLEAWLADEAVSVYDESASERILRWGRRHQNWLIFGTMLALIILLATGGTALSLRNTASIETKARLEAQEAQRAAERAQAEAEAAKQNGMLVAARFAARAVANEIDLRWRVLAHEAASPQLHQMLRDVVGKPLGSPEQRNLQQWLEARRKAHTIESESWFITDAKGLQVARDPFSRKSLYEDYSTRTYFHGGERDLEDAETTEPIKPISAPHLSSVYLSTSSGNLKVACSVPIWKDNEPHTECLGVLAMSVELGAFRELQTGLNAGQLAVLIDTRNDEVEGEARSGLILHHPHLYQAQQRRLAAGDESFFRVSSEEVEQLRRLRKLRAREAGLTIQPSDSGDVVLSRIGLLGSINPKYVDPLAAPNLPAVPAAFEPVRIESRPLELRDTGWVVSVQEDPAWQAAGRRD